jgi:hypothetical protein
MATASENKTLSKEEILAQLAAGSTDAALFDQLKKLNEGEAKIKAEKKGTVSKLVAEMEEYGITMLDLKEAGASVSDIDKLFDSNTIRLAAGSSTKGTRAPKSTSAKKTALIKLTGGGKRPPVYQQGDVLGSYAKPAFKDLFTKHGDKFGKELEAFYTPEGKEYFKTEEGKAELTRLIDHVKTKKPQPAAKK